MSTVEAKRQTGATGAGYVVAAVLNGILLWLIHVWRAGTPSVPDFRLPDSCGWSTSRWS